MIIPIAVKYVNNLPCNLLQESKVGVGDPTTRPYRKVRKGFSMNNEK